MKLRIQFSKYGPLRFIGHLDVMRFFQKAIRRAEIDIAYSSGFSPHQIMSFASPLEMCIRDSFGFAQSLEGGHIVQKLCHGQLVKQPEVLGQIAQTGFQLPFSFRKGLSIHQNTASCRQKRRHQQLHQSGFTRAVGPEQADQMCIRDSLEAEKQLLTERNTLFESLVNKLTDYPQLRTVLYELLFTGKTIPYNPLNQYIDTAEMFGFVKNNNGNAVVANRIFESILYSLFLSQEYMLSFNFNQTKQIGLKEITVGNKLLIEAVV